MSVIPTVKVPGRSPPTNESPTLKDPTMQPLVLPRCHVSSGVDGQSGLVAIGWAGPEGVTAACCTAPWTYWLSAAAWSAG